MNDPRPDRLEALARERVKALGQPVADPGFRERIKREFIAGTLMPSERATMRGAREGVTVQLVRRRVDARVWLPIAAAAAVLIAVALNRGPRWEVVSVTGTGHVTASSGSAPAGDPVAVGRLVRPGARLVLGSDVELTLRAPGVMTLAVLPGSDFIVPTLPGRWLGRSSHGAIANGEVRGTTGPRFAGARLRLDTPEARAEVTGTTFAVIHDSLGSCVCLLQGRVRFGRIGEEPRALSEGTRRVIYRDRRPTLEEEIPAMERMKLEMLRDQEHVPAGR